MKKYIGNKDKILPEILSFMESKIGKKRFNACNIFFDVFAGTNNVGYFFKEKKGFQIISNDINKLSHIIGKSYIELNQYPNFSLLLEEVPEIGNTSEKDIKEYIQLNNNGRKETYEQIIGNKNKFVLFQIFTYLSLKELPNKYEGYFPFIHRNYCENGEKSSHVNRYGEQQKRMFFSDLHGERIDDILNLIIKWKNEDLFEDDYEYFLLLAGLIEAATLFSNTSGVYESYYKKLFPNTKQQFRIPFLKEILDNNRDNKVYTGDIMDIVKSNNIYADIVYLDPPYNSREYTSNYHLLNLIADYHNIKNPQEYEKGLILGRGQHKKTVFKSSFCRKTTFIDSMRVVIENIKGKYVFISHYDGEDNLWKSKNNLEGFQEIKKLLSDEHIFKKGSFDYQYIARQNFQSKSGLKKKIVKEIIFFSEKNDFDKQF